MDEDIKTMSKAELRREVMKLRKAFRQELNETGNRRCWINLFAALPENKTVDPLSLPQKTFLQNCKRYFERNQCKRS